MATLHQTDLQGLLLLKLSGSLTDEGVEQVGQSFQAATSRPGARIVVDLGGVDMLTTPAISMFIAAANSARQSGGAIAFTQSPPFVHDVLTRLRLHSVLHTVPDVQQAIDQMRIAST